MVRGWRIVAALVLAGAMACGTPQPAFAARSSSPGLYVPEASLMTMDGTMLWQHSANKPRRVASCIKMLNALVVLDHASLGDVITVSRQAAQVDGGVVGLRTGQKLTVRQLLGVMLVHSANGAAEALATGIGGSEKNYVAMMNAKAKSLGLKHTHATDPHGLSPRGYSTAADLSVIASTLMTNPELRSIVRQSSASLPWGSYSTTDRLLGVYPGLEGGKTGYTDPAGYCFVAAAKRNGIELIGVVLGADEANDRFTQMRRLLDWGFGHACVRCIVSRDQTMGVVEVSGGTAPNVVVRASRRLELTVLNTGGTTTEVSLPTSISAPVQLGQVVGTARVLSAGSVCASVPLLAERNVAQVDAPARFSVASLQAKGRPASPSIWQSIASVVAGFGRLLGI